MKTIRQEAESQGKLFTLISVILLGFGCLKANAIIIIIGIIFLIPAILLYRKTKAGIILTETITPLMFGWYFLTRDPISWHHYLMAGVVLLGVWVNWKNFGPILRRTKTWDDPAWLEGDEELDFQGPEDSQEAEDSPLISIVLLQRHPRPLEEPILAQILSEAWGGDFSNDEDEENFLVSQDPTHIIRNEQGFWMIHNIPEPYADPKEMAAEIGELRLKKALLDHTAWLAVDLMRPANLELPLEVYYPHIFRLIKDLANEDTLVILRPETGQLNIWDKDVQDSLSTDFPLENFNTPSNPSVIQVSDDDPRMQAAAQKARSEFSIFRDRWEKRDPDTQFTVKAPISRDGNTEFIWLDVIGLEPEFIHGTLANEPVDLGSLKLGSQVEVPLSELNDWAILPSDDSEPLGLFTVKVVQEASR